MVRFIFTVDKRFWTAHNFDFGVLKKLHLSKMIFTVTAGFFEFRPVTKRPGKYLLRPFKFECKTHMIFWVTVGICNGFFRADEVSSNPIIRSV